LALTLVLTIISAKRVKIKTTHSPAPSPPPIPKTQWGSCRQGVCTSTTHFTDNVHRFFKALTKSDVFHAAWERYPLYWPRELAKERMHFGYKGLLDAAQKGVIVSKSQVYVGFGHNKHFFGTQWPTGMVIGKPKLEESLAMPNATFVINSAMILFDWMARICIQASSKTGFFMGINQYVSRCGAKARGSVTPHNDRKDVFILQIDGAKHWKLYAPENYPLLPMNHQERGKKGPVPESEVTGVNITELTLQPGDVLYVPRGYMHSTGTDPACIPGTHSIHLTLGIETDSKSQTYAHVLACVVSRAREQGNFHEGMRLRGSRRTVQEALRLVNESAVKSENMRRTLPFGFLKQRSSEAAAVKAVRKLLDEDVQSVWPTVRDDLDVTDREIINVLHFLSVAREKFVDEINKILKKVAVNKLSIREQVAAHEQYFKFFPEFTASVMNTCGLVADGDFRIANIANPGLS